MYKRSGKIVVIGTGFVGATFCYALMIKGVASEIVLIDIDRERAEGEAMDLGHGVSFTRPVRIRVGDYADCRDADIVVITAGVAQKPGETRLDLVKRNTAIFRDLVSRIVKHTQDAILLVVTNPVDIMSYVAYRLSGFPPGRVIGSGTVLDTSRFRYLLSNHCGVDPQNVHAYIVGEHGDTEVALWSLAHVAGMRFSEYCLFCEKGCDEDERLEIFHQVRDAAYQIIERKSATYYAIGLAMVEIVESILRNERSVLTVSTLLDNYEGVSGIYLSVPAILDGSGVQRTIPLAMSDFEASLFRRSGETVRQIISSLEL